jgi:serine/threonine protein kinase
MDLITGKDLRHHLSKEKQFSCEVSKFFLACTILGLEYIHYNNILHRDIKPDNLVLDKNGYVKITDFGISREIGKIIKGESSGTPGYMAPEVMCGKSHSIDSDYYCLGMMAYEFMKGVRPFICKSNAELKKKVMENDIVINKLELPEGWGIEAGDFINRLIKRKQNERLGHGGDTEVKNHLWFKGFRWDKLYRMELKAPFIPDEEDGNEKNIFIPPIDNEMMKRYKKIMNSKEYKVVFKNFLFFNLYDQNLNHEKYKNPHEIYEAQLIHKNKNFNNDENKKKNNIKDVEDNKDDVIDIKKEKEKMKSFNQPIKNKFNYMDIFHKKNYDFFEKSQNIPNINKFLKNDL